MQQQPVKTPQACPAAEAPLPDIPTTSQGGVAASLLLDATTLSGLLQQPRLESFPVLEAAQQATTSLPASKLGSAGNQEGPSSRREQQAGPGAAVPQPAACLLAHPATAADAQLVSSSQLQHSLAFPTRPEAVPPQQAPAALPHACSSVVLTEARCCAQLCHDPSTASYAVSASSSRSLEADILVKVDSVHSTNHLRVAAAAASSGVHWNPAGTAQAAAAAAASSGMHSIPAGIAQAAAAAASGMRLNPAGTAQGASTSPAERAVAAGETCSEADDRLKALKQGRGLRQLAALLSEESEMESDFSDDSGSGSGNGSGDGAAQGSSEFSSFLDQDDFAGQPKVQTQLRAGSTHNTLQ